MISDNSRDELLSLSEEALWRIDSVCGKFEQDLKHNEHPTMQRLFAAGGEVENRCLLRELLFLELGTSSKAETKKVPASSTLYERRFPDFVPVVREVFAELTRTGEIEDSDVRIPDGMVFAGRYRVTRLIGVGATGAVYLVEDLAAEAFSEPLARSRETHHASVDSPNRLLALKVLRPNSDVATEDLLEEARTLRSLSHPNIVKTFDSGITDGTAYLTMQYVEGPTLAETIRNQTFRLDTDGVIQAAELLAKIADALELTHRNGLTHRDVKPHNVLLDSESEPYLVDFGFALHERTQQQHHGDRSGTPFYRSPEQVRGQADWIDGRADVWAIGVVLYELTTGRRPFVGESIEEIDRQILGRDPKPPRQINDQIPSWLEDICLRCLSKTPAERFPTAGNVARVIREKGHASKGIPSWLAIPLAILASVVIAFSMWRMRDLNNELDTRDSIVEEVRGKQVEQAADAQRMIESVVRDLVDELDKRETRSNARLQEKLIRTALANVELLATPGLRGTLYRVSVQRRLAKCLLAYDDEQMQQESRKQLENCRALLDAELRRSPLTLRPPLLRLMGLVCDGMGKIDRRTGDRANAAECFKISESHRREWLQIVLNEPEAISCTPFLHSARNMPAGVEGISEEEHAELAVAISSLMMGQLYREMGDYQNARDCFQHRLVAQEGFFRNHPKLENAKVEYAGALRDLATAQFRLGAYDEAIENLHQSIPLQQELLSQASSGAGRPIGKQINLAMHVRSLGEVLLWAKGSAEAKVQFELANNSLAKLHRMDLTTEFRRYVEIEMAKNCYSLWLTGLSMQTVSNDQLLQRAYDLFASHNHPDAAVVLGRMHRVAEAMEGTRDEQVHDVGEVAGLLSYARTYAACAWSLQAKAAIGESNVLQNELRGKCVDAIAKLIACGMSQEYLEDSPEFSIVFE